MFFSKKKRRRRRHRKISLMWFTIKHLLLKISKYCLCLIFLSSIIFIIVLRFNENFRINLLNHPILKKIEQILKKSCYNIKIEGIVNSDTSKINFYIGEYCSPMAKNDYTLNKLKDNIKNDPWIKNISIRKELPYTMRVIIDEFMPFAVWKSQNEFHLINEEGSIIKISKQEQKRFYNLLIITGKNSKDNIKTLFNLLLSNPELTSKIRIADRIGSRRWNLELNNGIIVKLPEDNLLIGSWERLDKLLSTQGIEIELKTIDLRIEDKIYLDYKEGTSQEIKKIK